jgi:hypothetical protein
MRSVTVVLPASIWAMMPMLRCLSIATVRATVYAPEKREASGLRASKFKKTRISRRNGGRKRRLIGEREVFGMKKNSAGIRAARIPGVRPARPGPAAHHR